MKRFTLAVMTIFVVIISIFIITKNLPEKNDALTAASKAIHKPKLIEGREDGGELESAYGDHKIQRRSAKEMETDQNEYDKIRESLSSAKKRSGINQYAGGALAGEWLCRGPYNMPGAWEFTEMDDGTDTIYAVTCGHYGGMQFVWKGTLTGDDWTMITPKHPTEVSDLRVVPNGNGRRIILGHSNGKIMYSDNSGTDWTYASGFSGNLKSMIVNPQDSYKVYATDGSTVYLSTDKGETFSTFQSMGSSANTVLYTPRFSAQPNNSEVYMVWNGSFYKLTTGASSFTLVGSLPSSAATPKLGGDTRRFWYTTGGRKWYTSTNSGASFSYVATENWWYGELSADMSVGHYPGVNPEDPDIIIGGYSVPLWSRDAGQTTVSNARNYWGYYQNSVGNDNKVRINYHPDFQGNQFFYDGSGKLMTLRASDGGVLRSYIEWTKSDITSYADMTDMYYNISLFDAPSQETYRGGFIYGKNNIFDMTTGTQDQGWQNTRLVSYNDPMLSWDQVGGGDGPCCITGDGLIGWKYNYQGNANFTRIQLYNGTTYKGLSGTASASADFTFDGSSYFTPSVGDFDNGDRIWVLSKTLRRIEYNNGTITALEKDFTSATSYIQGIAQSHENPDIVYAMEDGTVFKSTDRGSNWSQIASKTATGMSGTSGQNRGMGWAIDNNKIIFASQSGTSVKAIYSDDGGVTWANTTGSGENLFPAAEVNGMAGTEDGSFVFASTNKGPYVFVVSEEQWYPLATDDDVPIFWGQIVYCVKFDNTEIARFSTWGQGVWDFVIDDNAPKLSITTDPNGGVVKPGENVNITWSTNQTGTVTVDLYQNDAIVKTLGASTQDGAYTWTVGADTPTGKGYKIQITLGSLTTTSSEFTVMPDLTLLPQQYLSVVDFSSAESGREASLTIDGDTTTLWHSRWSTNEADYPHEIVYKISNVNIENLLAFSYRPRMDASENGTVDSFELYISSDSSNWNLYASGSLSGEKKEDVVLLDNRVAGAEAVYVRFKALSEINGNVWASMSEFNLYCDNYGATAVIHNPTIALKSSAIYGIANNKLRLFSSVNEMAEISIYEVNGRRVFHKQLSLKEGQNLVDLRGKNLAAKQYLVRMKSGSRVLSRKVVLK